LFPLWELSIFKKVMRIIAKKTLVDFWLKHANAENSLRSWLFEAKNESWKSPADIRRNFPYAKILPDNRVIFRIKGNDYRLVVKINYTVSVVYIRFIGTHDAYDTIDPQTI
jgi:mRNA interferase HigB